VDRWNWDYRRAIGIEWTAESIDMVHGLGVKMENVEYGC
jgi:hypothetical protein